MAPPPQPPILIVPPRELLRPARNQLHSRILLEAPDTTRTTTATSLLPSRPPHLEVLEVGPLLVDHLGQQLVLQAVACHGEVDEGGLGLDLGLVVGVGQLGVEDQLEAGVEEALLVPHFDTAA